MMGTARLLTWESGMSVVTEACGCGEYLVRLGWKFWDSGISVAI